MQGAERIRADVARALQALGPDGAEGAMLDALRWLDGAAERPRAGWSAPIEALRGR
jgi:DNA repair protein RecN (Recombination protein N)